MRRVALTMLNSMGGELPQSLDRHAELGFSLCDLKDRLFGKALEELEDREVEELGRLLGARNLKVHCLSTSLGHVDLALGEAAWIAANESILGRVLAAARVLVPAVIRVIAATDTSRRQGGPANLRQEIERHPWFPAAYDAIVGRINAAGFDAVIENEARDCIVTSPIDVLDLFAALKSELRVRYTWDVQNMWEMGTAPSVAVLRALLPCLGMLHLKGGIAAPDGSLRTASSLADATWPVMDIVRAAIEATDIEVICLNQSHGDRAPGYDTFAVARDDALFLRINDPRIA
jgi:sugar phosphate isomerase/epimerase